MCLFRKLYPDDAYYSLDHFLGKFSLPLKDDVSYDQIERWRQSSLAYPEDPENL